LEEISDFLQHLALPVFKKGCIWMKERASCWQDFTFAIAARHSLAVTFSGPKVRLV